MNTLFVDLAWLRNCVAEMGRGGIFHHNGQAVSPDFARGFIDSLLAQGFTDYPLYVREGNNDVNVKERM